MLFYLTMEFGALCQHAKLAGHTQETLKEAPDDQVHKCTLVALTPLRLTALVSSILWARTASPVHAFAKCHRKANSAL